MNEAEIARQAKDIVALEPGSIAIFARAGWSAAPSPLGSAELDAVIQRMAAAEGLAKDAEIYLAILDSPKLTKGSVISILAEAMDVVTPDLRLSDVVVLTRSQRFAVIASEADFSIVLGEQSLVEGFLQHGLKDAIGEFKKYRDDWTKPPGYIIALSDADWAAYSDLSPGAEFRVRW